MRTFLTVLPALLLAGVAVAQNEARPDPKDARAKVPPIEYRSALEGYRPFTETELRDWRRANEDVGRQAAKPQPAPGGKK